MAKMTEEEAARLDELYTKTTPKINPDKPGIFAQQEAMVVSLDSFTSKYLTAKSIATKRSPSELISDIVRKEIAAQ
ncbi:MAG: hypothetical protein LBS67_03935 [Clostridiales Family XIII bacterium]|jgi:hypothetical protein|nr:hypothetical protein [Clostridiales Family XIII bacterium]